MYPTTLIFQERPADNPRATFVRHRGEFLQTEEKVTPGVLSILNPLPKNAPANRLTFARWLVAPENPMTARVMVNRQWAALFGTGIVRTVSDFGYQGEPPTHPELLDYLAVEFVKQGWALKKLHRLIVTSATYRQASRVTPDKLARDPENRLLSRGPRVRLDAELIRDAALAESGLLSPKMYGPSVFPAAAAGGHYGRGLRPAELGSQSRRGSLSSRVVHVRQAHGPLCDVQYVRRAERRGDLHAPRNVQHALAGAHSVKQRRLCRGRAGVGRKNRRPSRRAGGKSRVSLPPRRHPSPG